MEELSACKDQRELVAPPRSMGFETLIAGSSTRSTRSPALYGVRTHPPPPAPQSVMELGCPVLGSTGRKLWAEGIVLPPPICRCTRLCLANGRRKHTDSVILSCSLVLDPARGGIHPVFGQ